MIGQYAGDLPVMNETKTYIEESGSVAVLIDSVQQVGLLEQHPTGRSASDGIIGDNLETGAVESCSTNHASGASSYQQFLDIVSIGCLTSNSRCP